MAAFIGWSVLALICWTLAVVVAILLRSNEMFGGSSEMRFLFSAFIAFLIVFPIAMIKHGIDSTRKKKTKLKKIAIERGNVVTAKLIKIQGFSLNLSSVYIYEYFYDETRYEYRYYPYRSYDNPEMTKTLYFVNKPRKATIASSLKRDPIVPWPVVYLIVLAIVYWIMSIST